MPSERQQLDSFLERYTEDIAAAARRALRHLRRRVPGAKELVYDNYNGATRTSQPAGDVRNEVEQERQ
jgi:hypothetical protein